MNVLSYKRHDHVTDRMPVIYPDPPRGGYNPQFSCDTPLNHLKFKGGYQGGVYVIVMEGVINVVKY